MFLFLLRVLTSLPNFVIVNRIIHICYLHHANLPGVISQYTNKGDLYTFAVKR